MCVTVVHIVGSGVTAAEDCSDLCAAHPLINEVAIVLKIVIGGLQVVNYSYFNGISLWCFLLFLSLCSVLFSELISDCTEWKWSQV